MSRVFDLIESPIGEVGTLIEASAGTGKTYTITGLVLRLFLERKVDHPSQILVVTFTIAATRELRNRVREALLDALAVFEGRVSAEPGSLLDALWKQHGAEGRVILRDALLAYDELAILTIHGFCKRVLDDNAFESGVPFDAEFITDDTELHARAAHDFWRTHITAGQPFLAGLAVARGWGPETFLEDYRQSRRYPHTRVLPEPGDLDALGLRFESLRHELAQCWDRSRVTELLASSRLKKNKNKIPADPREQQVFLDSVEQFISAGVDYLVDSVLAFGKRALEDGVYKKDLTQWDGVPFLDCCEEMTLLVEGIEQSVRLAFIHGVAANIEKLRAGDSFMTFDDLLWFLHAAATDPEKGPRIATEVRATYRIALIDEFQDTDQRQYEIFRALFGERQMYLIGDPKQAIYAFRGADIFAYLDAKTDATEHYTLDRNWRSHPRLIQAINAIFERVREPFVFADIPFHPVRAAEKERRDELRGDGQGELVWWYFPPLEKGKNNAEEAEKRLADAVAAECITLLSGDMSIGERQLHPGDLAVLVRTNKQAEVVRAALGRCGLPSVIAQSGDIYQTAEAAEVQTLLEAVLTPTDRGALAGALATGLWGRDAGTIIALTDDEVDRQALVERCLELRKTWFAKGFMPMFQELLSIIELRARMRALIDGERRITNVLHLAELLHELEGEHGLSAEALIRRLARERARDKHLQDSALLRLESDARAVQIVTIHKSKGLEYNVVFCPFLWHSRPNDGKQPVLAHRASGEVVYDCGSAHYAETHVLAERERVAEDARLAYVALTRAKLRCYVAWGTFGRKSEQSALAYLLTGGTDLSRNDWHKTIGKDKADWGGALARFCDQNPDTMSFREHLDPVEPGTYRPGEQADRLEEPRVFPPDRVLPIWKVASFSSLTSGIEGERPDHMDPPEEVEELEQPKGILAFARGAHPGICLHEILEKLDFRYPDDSVARDLVTEVLTRFDLVDRARHPYPLEPVPAVLSMLDRVLRSPVPEQGFALAELSPEQRLEEWQFYLPMENLEPSGLAAIFATHARPEIAAYATRLQHLDPDRITGFLTGFVDLCFRQDGRWYVVDWKSNFLGGRQRDYDQTVVWASMFEHHYILQYHLYITALHRFLASRQAGYDYDEHMGPALYVFLRGCDGTTDRGWFIDTPPRALIEALDDAIGGRP